jgi:glucosamine--fructose-6-phosphate aminotransferase (isomerizing)
MKSDPRYTRFALVREMLETVEVIRDFDWKRAIGTRLGSQKLLLSGEGSSRIFPAKRAISHCLHEGNPLHLVTEGARQAAEYALDGFHVFLASNSGRTAEAVALAELLRRTRSAAHVTAVVASEGTPLGELADNTFVLDCGREEAVAATKSVVEQALYYHAVICGAGGPRTRTPDLRGLADAFASALAMDIPGELVAEAAAAPVLYIAGRNDGVAEELTLKTNEITRKKSDYLEGTYAVHGIEEVMQPGEFLVLIDPYPEEEEKIGSVIAEQVGVRVVAIAPRKTRFPTVLVPEVPVLQPYVSLAAGWNLLVEIGLALDIDLDRPERARKVGNEYRPNE